MRSSTDHHGIWDGRRKATATAIKSHASVLNRTCLCRVPQDHREGVSALSSLRSSTNKFAYTDSRSTFAIDPLGLVSSAKDCSKCCTNKQRKAELERSWDLVQRYWRNYSIARKLCFSGSCGSSADRLRRDLEAHAKPKCWITTTQLTTGKVGSTIRDIIDDPLGLRAH